MIVTRTIRLQSDSNAHARPWRVAVEQGFFAAEGLGASRAQHRGKLGVANIAAQGVNRAVRPRMARRTETAARRQGTAIVRVVTQTIVAAANDTALCANS
jgi:hypothetical protein